nr:MULTISPECIES: EndoU domain-containing protein [unclassified Corynebacterium]
MEVPADDPRPALTDKAIRHILDGEPDNPRQGGHRAGTSRRRKTEFPPSWSDADIIDSVQETFDDPHSSIYIGDRRVLRRIVQRHGSRVIVEAQYYVPDEATGTPIFRTAYPKSGDAVYRNTKDGTRLIEPFDEKGMESKR